MCLKTGRVIFLGGVMRVAIVRASAMSKALGRRGPVTGEARRVGTAARFEERAAAMLDKDRAVGSGGRPLRSGGELTDCKWPYTVAVVRSGGTLLVCADWVVRASASCRPRSAHMRDHSSLAATISLVNLRRLGISRHLIISKYSALWR